MPQKQPFRSEVENLLQDIYKRVGIDRPANHELILDFVADDVKSAADPVDWHSGDVDIAFRRFIESINGIF